MALLVTRGARQCSIAEYGTTRLGMVKHDVTHGAGGMTHCA